MTAATFTVPAGARLATDNVGITTRADAVVVCDERDAWMLRAVLGLPDADQRGNTSRNQVEPRSSMPCQAELIGQRSADQVQRMELERGLCAEA